MIWCVEDDAGIRDIEVYTLKSTGFEARGFGCGAELFEALETELPELILLDIMLPGDDGLTVLTRLRSSPATRRIPVIMASAKGMEYDKVKGLDAGADDYLVKPFGMMEMISRVKAVLRRSGSEEERHELSSGDIKMNVEEHTVYIGEEKAELTYKEFEILRLFLSHPGIVYTRKQLYSSVWGDSYIGETRTVDMHIRTLRQKLGYCGDRIATVRNVGYRFEDGTVTEY